MTSDPAAMPARVCVRTPATCANLGPGFDTLGLALTLYDEVSARVSRSGRTAVRVTGEGAGELPAGTDHLVVRAAHAAFETLGERPPGLVLDCANRIPQARGLGSSSAAIVSGILLARALVPGGADRLDDDAALRLAAEIEGHPDNVAPCLLGGFTIAWTQADGARAVRLEPEPGVRPVVFIPSDRGLTEVARAALPMVVPRADAVANIGRAALLVHAITADPDHLFAATEDRLHQSYRAPGMPQTAALVAQLRQAGVPAVVSGAGPSVLAFASGGWNPPQPSGWIVRQLRVDGSGAGIADAPAIVKHAEQDPVAAGLAS